MSTHADRHISYGERRPQTMLRDGPLLTGRFDAVASYGCERQGGTTDWLLFCTIAGAGILRHTGGELRIGPGTLVRCAPGTRQDYRTDPAVGRWRFHWIHWLPRPEVLPLLVWPEPAPGIGLLTINDAGVFTRLAERIADADMRASGGRITAICWRSTRLRRRCCGRPSTIRSAPPIARAGLIRACARRWSGSPATWPIRGTWPRWRPSPVCRRLVSPIASAPAWASRPGDGWSACGMNAPAGYCAMATCPSMWSLSKSAIRILCISPSAIGLGGAMPRPTSGVPGLSRQAGTRHGSRHVVFKD